MSFDRLAPHYRWMEWVLAGNKLQRCRTAFLSQVKNARDILILGEGNGRFLAECKYGLGEARITCVDASARMLRLTQNRLRDHGLSTVGVNFVHADALTWDPPRQTFDLVVTHFFLDCFQPDQLEQLIARLSAASCTSTAWLVADFQVPQSSVGRYRARVIHWLMYTFFRVFTRLPARRLTDPDPFLKSHGYFLQDRLVTDWGLLRSDLWQRGPA